MAYRLRQFLRKVLESTLYSILRRLLHVEDVRAIYKPYHGFLIYISLITELHCALCARARDWVVFQNNRLHPRFLRTATRLS